MNKYVIFDPLGRQYEIEATNCRSAIKKASPKSKFKLYWKCFSGITTYYREKSFCRAEPLWAVNRVVF